MANTIYASAKAKFLAALLADTIKAALVTSAYVPNFATDAFESAITAAKLAGTVDQTLAGKTVVGGKFSFTTLTWTAVPNALAAKYIVFYDSTPGSAGTNWLIVCIDTTTGVTMPVTANGGDITFTPDATFSALFGI